MKASIGILCRANLDHLVPPLIDWIGGLFSSFVMPSKYEVTFDPLNVWKVVRTMLFC